MRVVALLLFGLFVLSGSASTARAQVSPFHLEAAGTVMKFDGTQPLLVQYAAYSGQPSASDLFGIGAGFHVQATLDLGRRFSLGVRSGLLRDRQTPSVELAFAPPDTFGLHTIAGEFQHKLTGIPTHLILRFRTAFGPGTALYTEAGPGVVAFTEKITFARPGRVPLLAAAYQTCFSYLVGAGVTRTIYRQLAVVAGVDFYQALPGRGQIWKSGDTQQFFTGSLGVRFPR